MKIILFWSTFNDSNIEVNEWVNSTAKLSPFHFLSLKSHEKFGNEVELYTYQKIDNKNIPQNIVIKNADNIFPAKYAHNALMRGHSIAHISDGVRLKVASRINGGIPLDMDAVVLNPFPKAENVGWFATSPAKVLGGVAYKWGKAHPPLTVHDNSWDGKAVNMFPIIVNNKIKAEVEKLANNIFATLASDPVKNSKGWNYVMRALGEMIKVDRDLITCQPIVFCPIPGWLPSGTCYSLEAPTRLDGNTKAYGYLLPSINEILKNSITVQHCFESVYRFTNKPDLPKGFWLTVKEGSLVSKEAEFVLGTNWKIILNNLEIAQAHGKS